MRIGSARGQASLELLGWLPALFLAALVGWHLLAAGYLLAEIDGAAEAGALALAAGAPVADSARAALPGWSRDAVSVDLSERGRVTVAVAPPSPFPPLAEALEVSSTAWARPRDE